MNKYKTFANAAKRRRKVEKMCIAKKAYNSPEEAYQKNQKIYLCFNCNKWHRSGSFETFVRSLSKKNF